MQIVREEIFGPVAFLLKFSSVARAVRCSAHIKFTSATRGPAPHSCKARATTKTPIYFIFFETRDRERSSSWVTPDRRG